MAHSRRRNRYANPSERVRFGSMRYIPPFQAVPVAPGVLPGQTLTVPLPASVNGYYIQWTINVGVGPSDWGQAQMCDATNTHVYDHQFNDTSSNTVFYILVGVGVLFSTGLPALTGDKGVLIWNGNSLTFDVYRNGAPIPGMSFTSNGVPVFDHVTFIAGIESISGIIVQNSIPAHPPL